MIKKSGFFNCAGMLMLAVVPFRLAAQSLVITGTVKDAETKNSLGFCNVLLLNSVMNAHADANGKFKIEVPEPIVSPQLIFSYLGYESDTLFVSEGRTEYTVFLRQLPGTLNEVVVTGVSRLTLIKENPVSILIVSPKMIEQTAENNVIDVLAKNATGMNAVKTGPNVSKPFIRGLGFNRVLTLYDGVRQEGQQWGHEHAPEVDAYNIEKAEVIKGPSSLMYGSDALAGVVSMFPYIPTDSSISGKFISEYQNNNGLFGNGLRLGYRGSRWLWVLRGSYRIAKNFTNSIDGSVYNTGFREKNLSLLMGYACDKGFSHLNFTLYDNLQGIPDGSRDSVTRKFTKQIYEGDIDNIKTRPIVPDEELNSYALSPLHQHIRHHRVYLHNFYKLGEGDLDFLLAFQQNIRREFSHPAHPVQAGMYVRLNTINYGFQYNTVKILNIEPTIGINGMYQDNKNKNATDFPIPDYNLLDGGIYIHLKWKYNNLTVSGGLRYDVRYLKGNDFYVKNNPATGFDQQVLFPDAGTRLQFASFKKTFSGLSSGVGFTCRLTNQVSIKANIARGYRAPNINEFASNGLDPGAHIVYVGNRNFVPEFSLQEDLELSASFKTVSITASVFNNNLQHFIYPAQLTDVNGVPVTDAQGNRTFQYQQASAQLYGMEAAINIHPQQVFGIKGFSFENSGSIIYGFNRKAEYKNTGVNGEYLPFIPPLKLLSSINQEIKTKNKIISSVNIKVEADINASQNRYLALEGTETLTPAYTLFNAGAGAEIKYYRANVIQLRFQVNNVLDIAYQSGLSRLKYFEYYTQSPNGYLGIYNMGRNICVKIIVPF